MSRVNRFFEFFTKLKIVQNNKSIYSLSGYVFFSKEAETVGFSIV